MLPTKAYRGIGKALLRPFPIPRPGTILFRTYNINLVVRGQYHVVMNSDYDNGPALDVALRTKIGGSGNDKYHRTSATTWLGLGIAVAYLILVGVAAGNSES